MHEIWAWVNTHSCLGIAVVVIAAACSSGGGSSPSPSSSGTLKASQPKAGGSITVLESRGYAGDWPFGLDPATNVDAAPNQDMMEAIYGQLFMLGAGGKIQPDLATSYSFSPDAKDVTITLRQGVKLTDGTQAFFKNGGKWWQSMVQTAGAFDPAGGIGVGFRFSPMSPFSGVHDPKLDTMLSQAQGSLSMATRCRYYDQAAEYIARNYYGPFYFSLNPTNVSAKGIGGPGLTSPLPAVAVAPTIPWEDVWYNTSAS